MLSFCSYSIHLSLPICVSIDFPISIDFQDAQDQELEMKRDRVVTAGVVLIQKTFRGHRYRKRYVQLRESTIILQKHWRAFAAKRRYKRVSLRFLD